MKGADACFLVHSQNVNETYLLHASKLQQLVSFAVISWDFFVSPPELTEETQQIDWESCTVPLSYTPQNCWKCLQELSGSETPRERTRSQSIVRSVLCSLLHSTEGFRHRKINCEWEGCRRGRQRPPVPVECFHSPASVMLQGSAWASAK